MNMLNIFSYREINEGVEDFRSTSGAVLLDVRTKSEYADGHIEGSCNLPLNEIYTVGDMIPDKNTPLFVHCYSGVRSARAVSYLKGNGYKTVLDLGGISSYSGRIVSGQ